MRTENYSEDTLLKVAAAHMAIKASKDAITSGRPFPLSTLLVTQQLVTDAYDALGKRTESMAKSLARLDDLIEDARKFVETDEQTEPVAEAPAASPPVAAVQ